MATVVVAETRRPLTDDDDLPEAWSKVIAALEQEAHFTLDAKAAPSIEEITSKISPGKSDPTTKAVKAIFNKTLKCIDRFGGIIAQGASVVFGPSAQVFNAVSFLIHVSQDVQEVFGNLTALMERLSAFLERLNHRLGDVKADVKLPRNMRQSVYRVLEQFITIMALSYKLTHSWKGQDSDGWKGKLERAKAKTKVFIKVGAFGDDSGVKSAIATFEKLIAEVTGVQIDEIHRELSQAARDICNIGKEVHDVKLIVQETSVTIHETQGTVRETAEAVQETKTVAQESARALNEMRSKIDDEKDLKTIREALGILEKDAETHQKAHQDYSNQTSGTGTWLFEKSPVFKAWTDFRSQSDNRSNVLALQGDEGYGKSHLSHAIINRLHQQYPPSKTPFNVAIAWFYIPKETKKTAMAYAMWHVISQLAKGDKKFLKHLKAACADYNPGSREDPVKSWDELVLAYGQQLPAATFFIVLDGLDHADPESSNPLSHMVQNSLSSSTNPEGLRIRFLVSGRESAISELQSKVTKTIFLINLTPSGQDTVEQLDDLKMFVERRLEEMDKFKGDLSASQSKLRTRILDELPSGSQGNYNALKRKLNDIANSTKPAEVDEVLQRVNESNSDDISRDVRELNDRLPTSDIQQLNEILRWVATAKTAPVAPLLDEVLSAVFGENKLYDPIGFVKRHCGKLLEIDDDEESALRFPSSDVQTYLRKAPSLRETVPSGQIDLIQAMLRTSFQTTFGGLEIYDKFQFGDFFESKRNVQTTLVHLNEDANEDTLTLLEHSMAALCSVEGDTEKPGKLQQYASEFFDEHLIDTELEKTDTERKQRLGQRLFRVLREETIIDRWATDEAVWRSMTDWFEEDNQFCDTVVKWMKDEQVQKSIQSVTTDTAWVNQITSGKLGPPHVLQHVARRVLKRFYDQEDSYGYMLFRWLRGYFQKTAPFGSPYLKQTWFSDTTIPELEDWENWAKKELLNAPDEAQWHYRTASIYTMESRGHFGRDMLTAAITRCEKAIACDPTKLEAQMLKGEILAEMKDYTACIAHLDQVIQSNAQSLGNNEKYDEIYWNTIIPRMAHCHLKLRHFDTAAQKFRMIIERAFEKDDFSYATGYYSCQLIESFHQQGAFNNSLELLRTLQNRSKDGRTLLHGLLKEPGSEVHQHAVTLAHRGEFLGDLEAFYLQSVQLADSSDVKGGITSFLEFSRWRLRWYCGPRDTRESIIDEWETIFDSVKQRAGMFDWYTQTLTAKQLAHALFSLAKEAGFATTEAQKYISRLRDLSKKSEEPDGNLYDEAKLLLARVLHLAGDNVGARDLLRGEVRKAIKRAREEDDPRGGYETLAVMLPFIDDDVNASAAWSLVEPDWIAERTASEDNTPVSSKILDSQSARQLTNGSDGAKEADEDHGTPTIEGALVPLDQDARENTTDKTKLKGSTAFTCDGNCGHRWEYADDMYICKDCLNLALCPECYDKLQHGTLDITVCSSSHEHLHVPPLDVEAWRTMDREKMRLGGEVVTRKQWLMLLEKQWDLYSWEKAAAGVQKAKTIWLRRRKRREEAALANSSQKLTIAAAV